MRVKACEGIDELGLSLLLHFVQLEAALKLLRYWRFTKDGWPDRLDFLNANWLPLRDLKAIDSQKYGLLIGAGGRSLIDLRNKIAHDDQPPLGGPFAMLEHACVDCHIWFSV
jgi:hypothetical protein